MDERTARFPKYGPYPVEYIEEIRRMVGDKNQDNQPVSDESYLKMAARACKEFNETFKEQTID